MHRGLDVTTRLSRVHYSRLDYVSWYTKHGHAYLASAAAAAAARRASSSAGVSACVAAWAVDPPVDSALPDPGNFGTFAWKNKRHDQRIITRNAQPHADDHSLTCELEADAGMCTATGRVVALSARMLSYRATA